MTIVRVTSGGIPVTESPNGLPYYEAENGFGIPVTFVAQGGAPLGGVTVPYPAPPGFRWEFVIDDLTGQQIIDDLTGQTIMDLVGN
jgi:hypothetical protein